MNHRCKLCNSYYKVKRYKVHYSERSIHSKRAKRIYLCKYHVDIIDIKYYVDRGKKYNEISYKLRHRTPTVCITGYADDYIALRNSLHKSGIKVQ